MAKKGYIAVRIFTYATSAEICPLKLNPQLERLGLPNPPKDGVLLMDDDATVFDSKKEAREAAQRTIEYGVEHSYRAWPKSMWEFGFIAFKREA